MPRFAIAFAATAEKNPLRHTIVEAADQDVALRMFFDQEMLDMYSNDDQGYFYFKDDFADKASGIGNSIAL